MDIKKNKITIAGTGRLAHSLVHHLIKKDFIIKAVISRKKESAETFAAKYNIPLHSNSFADIPAESKVILLAIPDHHISSAASQIALDKKLNNKLFIHFSGTQTSHILQKLKKKGAYTASFHIMQTFPSTKIVKIKNCYAAIESQDQKLISPLFQLAEELELHPFLIPPENKIIYHLTGVLTSNFLVSHFSNSISVFSGMKEDSPKYFELFDRIIRETLNNIKTRGVKESVSGPAIRNDTVTIKQHIIHLKKSREKLLLLNYITETLTLINLITRNESSVKEYSELTAYLKKELKAAVNN